MKIFFLFNLLFLFLNISKIKTTDFKKIIESGNPIYATNNINGDISLLYPSNYESYSNQVLFNKKSSTLLSSSTQGKTCNLTTGEIINADKYNFHILNEDGTPKVKIEYTNTNSINSTSLACIRERFVVIKIVSDEPTVMLYNSSGESVKNFTMLQTRDSLSDCVGIENSSTPYFVCMFVNSSNGNETHYYILDYDLNKIKGNINMYHGYLTTHNSDMVEPYSDKENLGFKLNQMNSTQFLLTMIKNNTGEKIYTVIIKIDDSDNNKPLYKVSPRTTDGHFAPLSSCKTDINYVSVAIISDRRFAITCKGTNDIYRYAFVENIGTTLSYVKDGSDDLTGELSSSSGFSNVNIVGVQTTLGIFFNQNNDVYFTLLFYPICYDITISQSDGNVIPVNKNETYIDFLNNIKSGYIKSNSYQIQISTSEFNGKTTNIGLYYKDNSNNINPIVSSDKYNVESETFLFYSGILSGEYKYSYSIYITDVDIIVSCFLNIIVSCSSSFPNCNECKYIEGIGESCNICDTSNQYYPLTYDNGITKYYKNETRTDDYYLIGNSQFEKCHKGCKKCYDSTNNNCLKDELNCNDEKVYCETTKLYFQIKNEFDYCYKNESRPDGYYLNSNNKFEKCHEGCEKCYGSTNNNCLNDNTCLNNVFF